MDKNLNFTRSTLLQGTQTHSMSDIERLENVFRLIFLNLLYLIDLLKIIASHT